MQRSSSTRRFHSSLTDPLGRQVCVVTTAAVPWMTGTAINPTLRAAYLARETACKVTLVIPWLSKQEQAMIFPNNLTFDEPDGQAAHIRSWVKKRCKFDATFDIKFYPARYDKLFFSISPAQGTSIIDSIPVDRRDCAILEEPEHLNWWERKKRWTDYFQHVVGICHTNYTQYVLEDAGPVAAAIITRVTTWLSRIHTHKVIKLSDAIQELPRSVTEFTHGVASGFLEVGARSAAQRGQQLKETESAAAPSETAEAGPSGNGDSTADSAAASQPAAQQSAGDVSYDNGAYFIGKAVWGKGYGELLAKMAEHDRMSGSKWHLDVFGSGEDLDEIKARAQELRLDIDFKGAIDHLSDDIHRYKVLVNASLSDVVATTTAEALAMGKWVLVAKHPENAFFEQFANCLVYKDAAEFGSLWEKAVSSEPPPLTQQDYDRLTWEAATQRLLKVAAIAPEEWPSASARVADVALWRFYRPFTGLEVLSRATGKHAGGREAQEDLKRIAAMDPERDAAQGSAPEVAERHALHFSLTKMLSGWRLQLGRDCSAMNARTI